MNTKDLTNEQNICPKCKGSNLQYQAIEVMDDMMAYYPWKCEDCGLQGEEWYKLEFQGHNVYDEEGNIIEL